MAAEDNIVKELLKFLSNDSQSCEIRTPASEYLLGLTGGEDGRKFIVNIGSEITKVFVNLLSNSIQSLNINAIKSLVNLSSDEFCLNILLKNDLLLKLFKLIIDHNCSDDHSVSLSENSVLTISNIAHWEKGAHGVLKFLNEFKDELILYRVIERFFKDTEHLHHLASFFSNLTQIKEARLIFLDRDKLIFQRILSFISFDKSQIRQRGVVATVKNCCFEVGSHSWLLSDKVDILSRLLLPLAGSEEFDEEDNEKLPLDLQYLSDDKKREGDAVIRKILVEALFQLSATEECRKIIKNCNTYIILRELHTWEKDEECKDAAETLISLLIADEPETGMRDLNTVEIPKDIQDDFDKTSKLKNN